ncbi:MAG: hypothetical protein FWG70_10925 [Oscillospiraceae bacterium]|nr:hypothetical protein [Oscillospiraceae bacterium]
MKARITNVAISNDGEKTTIITNDDKLSKGQELACRLLSFRSFYDLDKIEEEARENNIDNIVHLVQSLREKLNDEEFIAEVEEESKKSPNTGGGFSLKIRARSDDEKYNQDFNIRVAGTTPEYD